MSNCAERLKWIVLYHDINANAIKEYDVLASYNDKIKKMKKKCASKAEFEEWIRREMIWRYWSKCEWELIVATANGRVILRPWIGSKNPDEASIDVTDRDDFNWQKFADVHIGRQIFGDKAKIDVYDQLQWRWQEFVDYCWYTRLRYERDNPKFHV